MSLTLYDATAPVLVRRLNALSAILEKAKAYAEDRKIKPEALLQARLYPDMFPLVKQVQVACDFAKGAAGRLGQADLPRYEDNEASFDELIARIAKTVAYIESVPANGYDGAEGRTIELKLGPREISMNGQDYLLHIVLPNVYFHLATAYGVLRHNGLDIGKADFIG